ncbi:MAG: DUF1554 domain-containing protein [Burkholderiales bacterium]|nr:DUF1554 domain-containing protein [Burkholderiales bacterium]
MKKSGLLPVLAGAFVFAGVSGCGGSSSSSVQPVVNSTAITIDNTGVVPVFGNSSTSTVVYIHNNTKSEISGITYSSDLSNRSLSSSLKNKLLSLFQKNKSLNSGAVNGSQCSTIAAGQSCPLSITTPVLISPNTQGSFEIHANYSLNKENKSFTQIVNYEQVVNNVQNSGAKFRSGVSISGYGNSTGYATIYLYGSGQNQVYDVSSMTIDKPAVKIVNGNISGHQIQSNYVQAVEISSPILSSSINAQITVQSSIAENVSNKSLKSNIQNSQFTNSASIGVAPISSGAVLTTGLVPLIDTYSGTNGTMFISNAGNQAAVVGSVSAGSGISNLSGCNGETLEPGDSCTVNFNVTESGGSANITVPYTGGSAANIVGNVTWFNSIGAALVTMNSSDNPIAFAATENGSATITILNIGGYTLRNINIPAPVVLGGSAQATISAPSGVANCATIESLPVGQSCAYVVTLTDSETDLGQQINLGFQATYAGANGTTAYSRVLPVVYNSTANGAIIAMTPADLSSNIVGNGLESTSFVLTVSNNGNLPADLTLSGFGSGTPNYLVESSTTCGNTLAASGTCDIAINFGPIYSEGGDSGTSTYTVDYTAAGQTPSGTVSSEVNWSVTPYAQNLSLTSFQANGQTSGTGSSSNDPIIFLGNNQNTKSIILTYTNSGTNAIVIKGVQDSNSVYTWQMNAGGGTTCIAGKVLQANDTCTVNYTNVLTANVLAIGASVGAVYNEDLTVPTFIFQDAANPNLQFQQQPEIASSAIIYAQAQQATLANSVVVNELGTVNESVTVTNLLANATGYSDIVVSTQMEDYFTSNTPDSQCTSTSGEGITLQECTLGVSNLSGSVIYAVNQSLLNANEDLNLTTLFKTNAAFMDYTISMNPIFAVSNLGMTPVADPLIFVTTGAYKGGYILQDANSSSPAPSPALTDGLAAGDYLCNLQAATDPVAYPGTYKALLAGTNRVAGGSDWVLQSNTTYINQLGETIATTDGNAKLPATLTNPISSSANEAWSGFDDNWGLSSGYNCSTWASLEGGNGGYGIANALDYAKNNIPGYLYGDDDGSPSSRACYGGQLHLYCVQQP